MSTTVNLNLRVDKALKDDAAVIFENYGMTTAAALKMFLIYVATTKKVPLSFDYQAEKQPTDRLLAALNEPNDSLPHFVNLEALAHYHETN